MGSLGPLETIAQALAMSDHPFLAALGVAFLVFLLLEGLARGVLPQWVIGLGACVFFIGAWWGLSQIDESDSKAEIGQNVEGVGGDSFQGKSDSGDVAQQKSGDNGQNLAGDTHGPQSPNVLGNKGRVDITYNNPAPKDALTVFKDQAYMSTRIVVGDGRPNAVKLGDGCESHTPPCYQLIVERQPTSSGGTYVNLSLGGDVDGLLDDSHGGFAVGIHSETNCWGQIAIDKYRFMALIENTHASDFRMWFGIADDGHTPKGEVVSDNGCGNDELTEKLGIRGG